MADVTYNVAVFPALLRTLVALGRARSATPILLAFKERDPTGAERTLWAMAEREGVSFFRATGVQGHGGQEVELWAGRFTGLTRI